MDISFSRHDCGRELSEGEQPTQFYIAKASEVYGRTKATNGRWYVLNNVVGHPDGLTWHHAAPGQEKIRIPLFSYTTTSKSLEDLLTVGMDIVLRVLSHPTVGLDDVELAHFVIGNVYDGGEGKGYQVWIGIALMLP